MYFVMLILINLISKCGKRTASSLVASVGNRDQKMIPDFENIHLMGVLFKHVQYWLTKEIHKYPIKKSKYIYSLPQRLSTYSDLNLHRYGKKNVCGKFLFFNGFSDMTFSLTTS